jgi:hypothetical protein
MNDDNNVSTSKPGNDIVLLSGAGASSYLGLLTLYKLLPLANLGNNDVARRIKNTRDAIQAEPDQDRIVVFEDIIPRIRSYIDTAKRLRTDFAFRKELGSLLLDIDSGVFEKKWQDTLLRCRQILIEEYGKERVNCNSEEFQTTLKLLEELAKLNSGELHIFTTNYDCSYQVLASNCKNIAFFCIRPIRKAYSTHIDANGKFSDQWFCNHSKENSNLPLVYIHQLHGCINNLKTDPKSLYNIDWSKIKLVASELIGEDPIFKLASSEFMEQLMKTKILFVWGYSFRDSDVLRVINDVLLVRGNSLKIYYLDPYLSIEEAYKRLSLMIPESLFNIENLKRIDWVPQDGHNELITKVITTLKGVI